MEIEKEQAERILKLMTDSLEQGKDFVIAQAPDVARQLIAWKQAEMIVYVVTSAILLFMAWRCAVNAKKHFPQIEFLPRPSPHVDVDKDNHCCYTCLWGVGGLAAFVAGAIMFLTHIFTLLQICLAPKIFLLEYLAAMTK